MDWDGTCVENVWPAEGDWLPGAVKALKKLVKTHTVYINTARTAPVRFEKWDELLPPEEVEKEVRYIRRMLDEAGLSEIQIWDSAFKLPAAAYIDDRAVRFEGNWPRILRQLKRLGV